MSHVFASIMRGATEALEYAEGLAQAHEGPDHAVWDDVLDAPNINLPDQDQPSPQDEARPREELRDQELRDTRHGPGQPSAARKA